MTTTTTDRTSGELHYPGVVTPKTNSTTVYADLHEGATP